MKRVLIAFILIWILSGGVIFFIFHHFETPVIDTAAVNDIIMSGGDVNGKLQKEYERIETENKTEILF